MAKKPVKKKLTTREYRRNLAKLKKAGLVSKNIDARSHKPTRYMLKQLERYKDVIEGKAKSVKVGSRNEARQYADLHRSKFDRVIIRTQGNETARYDKAAGAIRVKRQSRMRGVESVTQILAPKTADKIPRLPRDTKKKQFMYSVPFRLGSRILRRFFNTETALLKGMFDYDPANGGRFKDWKDYVEIIEVEGLQNVDENSEDAGPSGNSRLRNDSKTKKTTPKKKAKSGQAKKQARATKKSRGNSRKRK